MNTLDFEWFYKQLSAGKSIDETCFFFADDDTEKERYLGFLPQYDPPYWVGYCDIPDGAEFFTAEELVSAPVFGGKSLRERWDQVRILSIEGASLDDWLAYFEHI